MVRTSWPEMRTRPAVILAPCLAAPNKASATAAFPQPRAPTRPLTSPARSENEMSATMSRPVDPTSTRRSVTSRLAPSVVSALISVPGLTTCIALPDDPDDGSLNSVRHEVDADREHGEHD